MEIVRTDSSRLDEVEPLFTAMHEHHRAGRPRAAEVRPFRSAAQAWERRRAHYRELLASGRGHLFLAQDGGRAIGYAMVSEIGGQATLETGGRMAELESLSVLPGERGAGAGRALMAAAHELVRELGIGELMLYVMDGNDSAMRFYERFGMRPYLHVMVGAVDNVPMPQLETLHFTDSDDANALIASDPLALLIGFALDQQVTVQKAFSGPLAIKERLGALDAAQLAATDLEPVFRERPAIHRFPGSMAKRVSALAAHVAERYDGDAARVWGDAGTPEELDANLRALPGFGDMKVAGLAAVLAKRHGVELAAPLVPAHPTLGDVDSPEALAEYQAGKRAKKAALRAAKG